MMLRAAWQQPSDAECRKVTYADFRFLPFHSSSLYVCCEYRFDMALL